MSGPGTLKKGGRSGYYCKVTGAHDLIQVSVHSNESIDQALKRFNLKLQQSGLLRELKEHAHYEKPSEKRRRQSRRRMTMR